jgi:hypothetical protein
MRTRAEIARRNVLLDYTHECRQMDLSGAAVDILETMNTPEASAAVRALKRGQQRLLKRIDKAAAKLGCPYPDSAL